MYKQTNSRALLALLIGLLGFFASDLFAQNANLVDLQKPTNPCSGEKFVLPEAISVSNNSFAEYINISSLPEGDRRTAFNKLSNEEKASFVRLRFALQLIKRPEMTSEQRTFILDAISATTADIYDRSDPVKTKMNERTGQELEMRAMSVFEPKVAAAILAAGLNNKDQDLLLLRNYENLLKFGVNERKRLLNEMPIAERVNIWKTQLVYHLVVSIP